MKKLEIPAQNPARRSHFGRFLVICNGFYTDCFILITNFGDPPRCTNLKIQWNGTFQPWNWDNDLKVASEGSGHSSKLTAIPGHRLGVLKRFWRYFWKKTKIGHQNFDLLGFLSDLAASATHPTRSSLGIFASKMVFAVCYQNRAKSKEKIHSFSTQQKLNSNSSWAPS